MQCGDFVVIAFLIQCSCAADSEFGLSMIGPSRDPSSGLSTASRETTAVCSKSVGRVARRDLNYGRPAVFGSHTWTSNMRRPKDRMHLEAPPMSARIDAGGIFSDVFGVRQRLAASIYLVIHRKTLHR